MLSDVQMKRDATTGSFPFLDVFMGFEALEAVRSMFGDKTEKVLTDLRVDIQARPGYLRVDDETGNIVISGEYLRTGDERYLYLDVVHELVHVRQFIEGKELFDRRYSYVDRPTEIEAYQACVAEGRKIGMENDEVLEYLRVEWITEEEFGRLLASVGVKPKKTPERPKKSGA
ncbi:MAG: hypothetical protein OK454_00450 [Thaumarchaeota archaeon]|nr:hypothetical protein [Nitrososphaerota archaeon]